jgi:hypothetical protein
VALKIATSPSTWPDGIYVSTPEACKIDGLPNSLLVIEVKEHSAKWMTRSGNDEGKATNPRTKDFYIYYPNWAAAKAASFATTKQGAIPMLDEIKQYVTEYRSWIFTILLIVVIDHFFLNGALKARITETLGKKLEEKAATPAI